MSYFFLFILAKSPSCIILTLALSLTVQSRLSFSYFLIAGSLGNSNQVTPSPRPGNTKTPPVENPNRPRSGISIALGDLVKKTAPTPISQPKPVSTEKKGPAWGGKIPLGASPSRLQDIQVEYYLQLYLISSWPSSLDPSLL